MELEPHRSLSHKTAYGEDKKKSYSVHRHVSVPMTDGVCLSARIWLPETVRHGSPAPAIFEYIPYRKSDMVHARDARNHRVFAQHGYVSIRVDMRGSGDSEGVMQDMYDPHELDDAITVINWIAAQPWCNGRVGMMGTSWGGTSALQAAFRRPKALKAIIAVCATTDHFEDDIHYSGGCVLTDSLEWGATLPAILASPPSMDLDTVDGQKVWSERLNAISSPLEIWLDNPIQNNYWKRASVAHAEQATDIPILTIGGWADRYNNTVMDLVGRQDLNAWGIIGPWGHHYPDVGEPGPAIDFQGVALDWWDHWLSETDNGIPELPRLRVWRKDYQVPNDRLLRRAGGWIATQDAPILDTTGAAFTLTETFELREDDGTAEVSDNHGMIDIPAAYHAGLSVGDTGYFGRMGGLPLSQTPDQDDSLIFETAQFTASQTLWGHPKITLTLPAGCDEGMIALRLIDVPGEGDPDTPPALIAWAVKSLALTEDNSTPYSHDKAASESPSAHRTIEISLPNQCYRLASGHRLRLAISSSLWPLVMPMVTDQTIKILPSQSTLALEFLPDGAHEPYDRFAPSRSSADAPVTVSLSAPSLRRWTSQHEGSSEIKAGWTQPYVSFMVLETGLEFGFETRMTHRIDAVKPGSAESSITHKMSIRQSEWSATIQTDARMWVQDGVIKSCCGIQVHENQHLRLSKVFES